MMVTIQIPPLLRSWFNGRAEVRVRGGTLRECLQALIDEYPGLEIRLKSTSIFLNGELVQLIHYAGQEIREGDEIIFLPKMSGG